MKVFLKTFFIIIFPVISYASDALSLKVANLSQDFIAISKELAQMRLEIESLNRENKALKEQVAHLSLNEAQFKKQTAQIAALNIAFESYKKSMLIEVSHEIDAFSKETQKAIDQLTQSITVNAAHNDMIAMSKTPFQFSDDYSKEGTSYTVKTGDTLSVIALKNSSTTKDIQNANRIADPRELKAGQVIFIPLKKPN